MELEKLIAAFKAKYPNVKLSDAKLKAFATKLAPKITDETTVDARLEELDEIMPFEDMAKEEARVAKLEAKAKEKKKPELAKDPVEEDDDDETIDPAATKKDRTPAYVKKMMEKLESLTTEISTIKSEKAQSTIKQKVADKLKEIPETYWNGWALPENEDGLEEFVSKVTRGYEGFSQDMADKGFANMSKPKSGTGGADGKKASDEEIKSILANL